MTNQENMTNQNRDYRHGVLADRDGFGKLPRRRDQRGGRRHNRLAEQPTNLRRRTWWGYYGVIGISEGILTIGGRVHPALHRVVARAIIDGLNADLAVGIDRHGLPDAVVRIGVERLRVTGIHVGGGRVQLCGVSPFTPRPPGL